MIFKKKGAVDWLVVGLGNPEPKYDNTRHNVGFKTLDKIAKQMGVCFSKSKFKGLTATCNIKGQKVLLLKPLTYMNLSGEAVQSAVNFYKIPTERVLVIFDDISLDVGKMRIRRAGSDGGHNGIKNICLYLDESFPRIKVGVGKKPHPDYDLASWVLSKFTKSETADIERATDDAVLAAEVILSGDIDKAMNLYNS